MGTLLIIVCIVICFFLVKCLHRLEEMIDLLKNLEEMIDLLNSVDLRLSSINGWLAEPALRALRHPEVRKEGGDGSEEV